MQFWEVGNWMRLHLSHFVEVEAPLQTTLMDERVAGTWKMKHADERRQLWQ